MNHDGEKVLSGQYGAGAQSLNVLDATGVQCVNEFYYMLLFN